VAAYFDKKSVPAKIIDLCLQNKLKVYASKSLFKELEFILKNIRASREYKTKIYDIFDKATVVEPKRIWAIKDDPDDDKFLGVACSSKAQYLITSDRHLLKLKIFNQTKIIKPVDFWKNIVLTAKSY
jgi:putative PIN family toxin of toxin-antitoxin system